ncbi:hypothetical protein L3Q82_009834, partial [Scortum barcoo]
MNVTEQDEGCYHCLFNFHVVYPTLMVLSQVQPASNSMSCMNPFSMLEDQTLLKRQSSCPARPQLRHSHQRSQSHATVTVTSTTAVLSGLRGNGTQVGCAVRVLSGPQIEVFLMIPEVKLSRLMMILKKNLDHLMTVVATKTDFERGGGVRGGGVCRDSGSVFGVCTGVTGAIFSCLNTKNRT